MDGPRANVETHFFWKKKHLPPVVSWSPNLQGVKSNDFPQHVSHACMFLIHHNGKLSHGANPNISQCYVCVHWAQHGYFDELQVSWII